MKQPKKNYLNRSIWMMDEETFTDTGRAWLTGGKKLFSKAWVQFFNLKDANDDLFSWFKTYPSDYFIIYYHNGCRFDIKTIESWCWEHQVNEIDFKINENYFIHSHRRGKKYRFLVHYFGKIIEFRCTWLIFPTSIKELGGKNHKIKFRTSSDLFPLLENENLYWREDIETIVPFLEHPLFYGTHHDIPLTIGSYVRKLFRESGWFAKNNLINQLTANQHQELSKLFRGGFCQVNPNFQGKYIPGIYRRYDRKSHYPTIMTGLLPYGKPLATPPKGTFVAAIKVEIYHLKLKAGFFPVIGFLEEGAYQYKPEYFNVEWYCWECEWEYYQKIYEMDYKIINMWYFRSHTYLKEFIEKYYLQRKNAKAVGNKPLSIILKFLLNNVFGKEGQKTTQEEGNYRECYSKKLIEKKQEVIVYFDKITHERITKNHPIYENRYYIKNQKTQETNTFKMGYTPMASYITAVGRVIMYNERDKYGKHWAYTDTDSLILWNKEMDEKELGEDLGYYGMDNPTPNFFCHTIKKYWYDKNFYFNGVRKESMETLNFDTFQNITEIKEGQTFMKYDNGRPIISRRTFHLIKTKSSIIMEFNPLYFDNPADMI